MLTTTITTPHPVMAVVTDKTYYRELGRRIAERRKALGITQVQLAEHLGVAQQTMAHYEGGRLRLLASTLVKLAELLDVPVEELAGSPRGTRSGKRGPPPKIQQQLERIEALPKSEQRVIAKVLDSMLAQSSG